MKPSANIHICTNRVGQVGLLTFLVGNNPTKWVTHLVHQIVGLFYPLASKTKKIRSQTRKVGNMEATWQNAVDAAKIALSEGSKRSAEGCQITIAALKVLDDVYNALRAVSDEEARLMGVSALKEQARTKAGWVKFLDISASTYAYVICHYRSFFHFHNSVYIGASAQCG